MAIRTNVSDDTDFIKHVIDARLLEASIDFIVNRYDPENLFDELALDRWACSSGYVKYSEVENHISALEDDIFNLKNMLNDCSHE